MTWSLTEAPEGPGDPGVPDSPRGPWAPSGPRAPVGPASPWLVMQKGEKTWTYEDVAPSNKTFLK